MFLKIPNYFEGAWSKKNYFLTILISLVVFIISCVVSQTLLLILLKLTVCRKTVFHPSPCPSVSLLFVGKVFWNKKLLGKMTSQICLFHVNTWQYANHGTDICIFFKAKFNTYKYNSTKICAASDWLISNCLAYSTHSDSMTEYNW